MSDKYVACPNCGSKKLGAYDVHSPNKHTVTGTCPHCGKRYRVTYGKGSISAEPT